MHAQTMMSDLGAAPEWRIPLIAGGILALAATPFVMKASMRPAPIPSQFKRYFRTRVKWQEPTKIGMVATMALGIVGTVAFITGVAST